MKILSQPLKLGSLTLKNRIVYSPMTRARAPGFLANSSVAEYYKQRSNAGLLITEATFVSERAVGWNNAPGIWTKEMSDSWKPVVDTVHKESTPIFMQLWHAGRASHSSFFKSGLPFAPSAVKLNGEYIHTPIGKQPYETPHAMTESEIRETVNDFKNAAVFAKEAGFDGVELHSANGYLIDEFLQSRTNLRTDKYGGSIENQFRFLREIVEAVSEVFPGRLALRLSPNGVYNDQGSPNFREAFTYYIQQLNDYSLAYLHVVDGLGFGFHELGEPYTLAEARKHYNGFLIGNCGYTFETAEEAISSGQADMISFGRPYLSTPDLVQRYEQNLPLNDPAPFEVWYTPGSEGYTDFPTAVQLGLTKE